MFILKRLCGLGEAAVGRVVEELLSNPQLADGVGFVFRKVFEVKARFDRTMQTALGLLNLPSRSDLGRVLTKLEAIQGSLVNLNLKVDRLLATHPPRRRSARRKGEAPDSSSE